MKSQILKSREGGAPAEGVGIILRITFSSGWGETWYHVGGLDLLRGDEYALAEAAIEFRRREPRMFEPTYWNHMYVGGAEISARSALTKVVKDQIQPFLENLPDEGQSLGQLAEQVSKFIWEKIPQKIEI